MVNKIAESIHVQTLLVVSLSNMRSALNYYKLWVKIRNNDNPDNQCVMDYAKECAIKESKSFEDISQTYPDYKIHPTYIKAQAIYDEIIKL